MIGSGGPWLEVIVWQRCGGTKGGEGEKRLIYELSRKKRGHTSAKLRLSLAMFMAALCLAIFQNRSGAVRKMGKKGSQQNELLALP